MMFSTRSKDRAERRRKAQIDNHIAQLAYAYVKELVHPLPDGVMVDHTLSDLVNAIGNLSYENRARLSGMHE